MKKLHNLNIQKLADDNPLVDKAMVEELITSDFNGLNMEGISMMNFTLSLPYNDAPEASRQARNEQW